MTNTSCPKNTARRKRGIKTTIYSKRTQVLEVDCADAEVRGTWFKAIIERQ